MRDAETLEVDTNTSAQGLCLRDFARRFPTKFTKFYAASKVRTDPAYDAVHRELNGSNLPLLDIGCGMGVLAFYLVERGFEPMIQGFDYDESKIVDALKVCQNYYADRSLKFSSGDARKGLPKHLGSVTILDILQYFSAEEMETLLRSAARCVAPGGKLIIRSGLQGVGWRFKVTTAVDQFARRIGWMQAVPVGYPTADQFRRVLEEEGLVGTITPLWGKTPFNNYLISFSREG